jgi:antitoxin YefM
MILCEDVDMNSVNFTDLRSDLVSHFNKVESDNSELVVTRPNHKPMVIMPLSELEGMRETLYLLSTPANAEELMQSIAQLNRGEAKTRELIEK